MESDLQMNIRQKILKLIQVICRSFQNKDSQFALLYEEDMILVALLFIISCRKCFSLKFETLFQVVRQVVAVL